MLYGPKSLKVVKFLLARGSFKQKQASEETGVALGYVNEVISKLRKKFIVSSGRKTVLSDARRLLLALAAESSMSERLHATYEIPGDKKEVEALIAKEFEGIPYAFTLSSALPHYSKAAQGRQASVYVDADSLEQASELLSKAGARKSNIGNVQVFAANEGILFDRKKTRAGYCVSLGQLLIDLYSYPPLLYLGQALLELRKTAKKLG